MSKKKGDLDAAADFFGDRDLDWMAEGESVPVPEVQPGTEMPISPDVTSEAPPVSTNQRTSTPLGEDRAPVAPADLKRLSSAPTLVFSSVPTLPPQPVPRRLGKASAPPLAEAIDDEATEAIQPLPTTAADDPTEQVERPAEPAPSEDPPSEVSEPVFADAFEEPGEPLVRRTHDPAPARIQTPAPASGREARMATPPPAPRLRYAPPASEAAWRQAASVLTAQAARSDQGVRGGLLHEAAQILHRRVGDLPAAEALYREAIAAGFSGAALYRSFAELLGQTGAYDEQANQLVALAARIEGDAAVDALIEASLLLSRRLQQHQGAVELLRQAATLQPDDYIARALLRALLPSMPDSVEPRLANLEHLARLAEGGIAADALVERAIVLEQLGRMDAAVVDLRRALELESGHTVAFLRLERLLAGDGASQAAFYEAEAQRDGQPDAGWWWYKAARARQVAGDPEAAQAGYLKAVADGYVFAERERQAAWLRSGGHSELVESLEAELAATPDGEGRAFAAFRLGWAKETLVGDRAGALEAYREALRHDRAAVPAVDGVSRLLAVAGDAEALAAFWNERLEGVGDADRDATQLRVAEIAETQGDDAAAEAAFRAAMVTSPGTAMHEVAAAGLARMLGAREAWSELSDHLSTWAAATDDVRLRVSLLRRAAAAGPTAIADTDRARGLYLELLEVVPDDPDAIEALAALLGAADAWRELAGVLEGAGQGSDAPGRRAAYLYRAARVLLDRCADAAAARPLLEAAVAARPDFVPALWLLREAAGLTEPRAIATMYRQHASAATDPAARAWSLVAAAQMGGPDDARARQDLRKVLDERPDHPGALAAMEVRCLVGHDSDGLVTVCRGGLGGAAEPSKAREALRVADLLLNAGRVDEATAALELLAGMEVEGRPLRAAARVACSLGAWDLVGRLLAPLDSEEDQLERARILGQYADPQEALGLYEPLLTGPHAVAAGSRASTVAQRAGRRDAMVAAYAAIADHAEGAPLVAAYSAWTAMQMEGMGHSAAARSHWARALIHRPGSDAARQGLARCLVASRSLEELVSLRDDAPGFRRTLVDYLLAMQRPAEAAEELAVLLEELPEGGSALAALPLLVLREHVLETAGDWQGVYEMVTRRRSLLPEAEYPSIDAKRRWLLREKLTDSDAAWELYRQLHDESPDDREVTESLARIAGARGETERAIGYLRELASSAGGPDEAARYQRRIGEVYEAAGDRPSARQAFLDALDHVNDDGEALTGLKRLARADEDWPGLIAVLQREVNLGKGFRALELAREIAQITEEHLGDRLVAIDAWRSVLERSADDRQALERLLELSEAEGEWGTFVEVGERLSSLFDPVARGALLRRVGIASQDHLDRSDAVRYFEQAVSLDPPDFDAAVRLEDLYRQRADWPAAIRVLGIQARSAVDADVQMEALLRAARLEIEANHDRDAGADYYAQVLDLKPDHEGALRFMASHLFEAGRFDEALPVCERLEPVVESGQDLDDFDTRMELASFYFYMAEMLRLQLEEERAVPRYERALELNPTHLPTLEAVGPLYLKLGRWTEAQNVYRQLLQLSGGQGDRAKVADTYTSLGRVEHALGNRDKAQKRFTKALELHPNHIAALKGMANVLEEQGVWSSLLNVYNNIICHATEADDVKTAYMTKGRILDEHMQRQDKAAQHYQRSLDFEPDQPVAYLRLAELAMRRDAYAEAGALATQGLSLRSDELDTVRAPLLMAKAAALHDGGKADEARATVDAARSADGSFVDGLGAEPLADLERLRQAIKERLPA